jgi:Raf kinase inhibitor-like YbhB/YbcL family protein
MKSLILATLILASCSGGERRDTAPADTAAGPTTPATEAVGTFRLESPAFANGGAIPRQYTCDGANISPALRWSGTPTAARALALICDDPDAPSKPWTHWVIWSLPATREGAIAEKAGTATGMEHQGINDFGRGEYGGPCPPGGLHHYHFRLYALDTALGLTGDITASRLTGAMNGHILGIGELVGTYARE